MAGQLGVHEPERRRAGGRRFPARRGRTRQRRIIYDPTTGKLSYNIDGAGGKNAIQFALVSENLALTYKDFVVI